MNVLVLGASGMAGHMISTYFSEKGCNVTGYCRRECNNVKTITGDIRDLKKLERTVVNNNFDIIINAVGLLNDDAESRITDAIFINSLIPHFLADITRNKDTWVIHISTDCVFSGRTGNYTEQSFCDGETYYDRTKALGELMDKKNLTLRMSIVGPDINENGIGLLNWFMKQKNTVYGYTNVMWTGVTTLELAKIIYHVAQNKCVGIVNMVYSENISKYSLLQLFNKYMRNNSVDIVPKDDVISNKTLIRTNFECNYIVKSYDQMVREMSEWIMAHKDMYPHYYLGGNNE